MKFAVNRASQGATSTNTPCRGAVRGPESKVWPGEYEWFVEVGSLEELLSLLREVGGGMGLFSAEDGEAHPALEIFDDDQDEA